MEREQKPVYRPDRKAWMVIGWYIVILGVAVLYAACS